MISGDLGTLIRDNFVHEATLDQENAMEKWEDFILSRNNDAVFMLKGYAGTGKTSLVAAMVRTMCSLGQKVCLLAPTGRAAKVFSLYSGMPAHTIHKRIYRQKSLTDMNTFQANVNMSPHTLFIVDESSMIGNDALSGTTFGTGRLLDDLVHFVFSCEGCRLMLVGDTAQLPPVGEEESPALCREMMAGYGLEVTEVCMTQVVRQAGESGILCNATLLRSLLVREDVYAFPRMRLEGFADIRLVTGNELIDTLEGSYRHCGTDGTIVVTRSNKRAGIFNNGIRSRLLDYEEELCAGDLVMVARNNYFWLDRKANREAENSGKAAQSDFIANGDIAEVRRIRNVRSFYGFRFADAILSFPDYDNREVEATVLLDTLQSETPALSRELQEHLFRSVWEDYPEIRNKRDRMKKLREDPLYNALQIKYAYAVTCHKAQGGQWQHVYIDQGYVTEEMLSRDYYRWLYTAVTRATEKVYLVNWPVSQTDLG